MHPGHGSRAGFGSTRSSPTTPRLLPSTEGAASMWNDGYSQHPAGLTQWVQRRRTLHLWPDRASRVAWGFRGCWEQCGGVTARADTSPKEEESKEGSPPPRGGEWVLVAPCAGFELLRVSYKRVFKNL